MIIFVVIIFIIIVSVIVIIVFSTIVVIIIANDIVIITCYLSSGRTARHKYVNDLKLFSLNSLQSLLLYTKEK